MNHIPKSRNGHFLGKGSRCIALITLTLLVACLCAVTVDAKTTKQTSSSTNGYLNIKINGVQKQFKCYDGFTMWRGDPSWSAMLRTSKNTQRNGFFLSVQANVESGDNFDISSADMNDFYGTMDSVNSNTHFNYTDKNAETFFFGNPVGDGMGDGQHESSWATIHIDKWPGPGGYATGTIEGEIEISDGDVISFTDGKFKIKIAKVKKSSSFPTYTPNR